VGVDYHWERLLCIVCMVLSGPCMCRVWGHMYILVAIMVLLYLEVWSFGFLH
jgi:hypothetical protein